MLEKIADVQHKIWAHWMAYLFDVSEQNEDGSVNIPADKVSRWKRQVSTQYSDLSTEEKKSDLEQASKLLSFIRENT